MSLFLLSIDNCLIRSSFFSILINLTSEIFNRFFQRFFSKVVWFISSMEFPWTQEGFYDDLNFSQEMNDLSGSDFTDSGPELDLSAAENDPSLLHSYDLDQTKSWLCGRYALHGQFTSSHCRNCSGVLILPLADIGLLRNSRHFPHIVFAPLSEYELQTHPLYAELIKVLNK